MGIAFQSLAVAGLYERENMANIQQNIRPGMHPNFELENYTDEEQKILNKLKHEWFLTRSSSKYTPPIVFGASVCRFFLMKPTTFFSEMFNLDREIVCVFSPYDKFEPRTLDAFDIVYRKLPDLRAETVCRVLISKDVNVEPAVEKLLKSDPEQPIVIPFSYKELVSGYEPYFIRSRFQKHLYSRDLFSFMSPLKKDLYFFGRKTMVLELVNRHKSGEHTGLFGLRKSGKTSILYAIERLMSINDEKLIFLDCESPSIHKLRWNELLYKLVAEYKKTIDSKAKTLDINKYSEKEAADAFSADMKSIYESKKRASVMIIFDEIERVSPKTGSSSHWKDGEDFILFWQTMRSFYQRNPEMITYLIAGTNPSPVEQHIINGQENPLFGSIPCKYVPAFSFDQIKEMVGKLGYYMGMKFDDIYLAKLTEDFGGHPFLVRQFCSILHKMCPARRPISIDKVIYEKAKEEFKRNFTEYFDMIVQVLFDWYSEEYDMLTFLANGDMDSFNKFISVYPQHIKHLLGYGLIQQGVGGYSFNIESVKDYLCKRHKYERINLSEEEKRNEISERRNKIEQGLRVLIKQTLKIHFGKETKSKVLASVDVNRREVLGGHEVEILLARNKSLLYFKDLINIIIREWDVFKNVFNIEKEKLRVILNEINEFRVDAHANMGSDDEFTQIRLHFNRIENILTSWDTI